MIAEADLLRETLRRLPAASITVAGSSMAPLLRPGDLIGVQRVAPEEIRPGQIITFISPDEPDFLVTHRAVGLDRRAAPPLLLARGDRSLVFDPPISAERILGYVTWRQRDGRVLRLDQGAGAWLSAYLGRAAERERRLVTGVPLPAGLPPAAARAASDAAVAARGDAGFGHILRRASHAWSRFIAHFVHLAAAAPGDPAAQER